MYPNGIFTIALHWQGISKNFLLVKYSNNLHHMAIKKGYPFCTAPKKLDTYWGHFYVKKKKVRR